MKTLEGVYILKLLDKRLNEPLIKRVQQSQSVLIQQIHFELPPSSTPENQASVLDDARQITQQANSCDEMAALGKKFGSSRSGSPGKVEISQLSPQIQGALNGLPIAKPSEPIKVSDGYLSVMLCERDKKTVSNLTKKEFRDKIVKQLIIKI